MTKDYRSLEDLVRSNIRVRKILENIAKQAPQALEVPHLLIEILKYIEHSFGPSCNVELFLSYKPEHMGKTPFESLVNLVCQIKEWLKCCTYSIAYRAYLTTRTIILLLYEHEEGLPVIIMARTLMEIAALSHYVVINIEKHLSDLESKISCLRPGNKDSMLETIKTLVKFLGKLMRIVRATRFNWRLWIEGDLNRLLKEWDKVPEELRQVNILTMIDKMPNNIRRKFKFWYNVLCDFCHPNLGSSVMVIDKAKVLESHPHGKISYVLAANPKSEEILYVTIWTITTPISLSIELLYANFEKMKRYIERFENWCNIGLNMLS